MLWTPNDKINTIRLDNGALKLYVYCRALHNKV